MKIMARAYMVTNMPMVMAMSSWESVMGSRRFAAGAVLRVAIYFTPLLGAAPTLPVAAGAAVLAVGFALQLCDGARLARLTDRVRRWPAWVQGGLAAVVFTIILGLAPEGVAPFIYFQF